MHTGQALAGNGRLLPRFAPGDRNRQRQGGRCGRSGTCATGHGHAVRAHIRENQAAKFLGAIAGQLPGSHDPSGERRRKAGCMSDLKGDLLFGVSLTNCDQKRHGKSQTSHHR
jgi:hypothetical protein